MKCDLSEAVDHNPENIRKPGVTHSIQLSEAMKNYLQEFGYEVCSQKKYTGKTYLISLLLKQHRETSSEILKFQYLYNHLQTEYKELQLALGAKNFRLCWGVDWPLLDENRAANKQAYIKSQWSKPPGCLEVLRWLLPPQPPPPPPPTHTT